MHNDAAEHAVRAGVLHEELFVEWDLHAERGFNTSTGRFVGDEEAYRIAEAANQVAAGLKAEEGAYLESTDLAPAPASSPVLREPPP